MTAAHSHAPTHLRERKAMVLARFGFADVYSMFKLDTVPDHRADPCPCCGAAGLNFLRAPAPGFAARLTSNLCAARLCVCSACRLRADPVQFVQQRLGIASVSRALDAIEAHLDTPQTDARRPSGRL